MSFRFRTQPRQVVIAALIILAAWLTVILPVNHRYRSKIKSLQPADVERITFEFRAPIKGQVQPGVVLMEAERREFLRLLAESWLSHPSHPEGVWSRFARMETKTKSYYLPIHATSNNGTLVWLFSSGTVRWNHGTLRNDELKPFVEGVFARGFGTNEPPVVLPATN